MIEYAERYREALDAADVNALRERLVREYAWAVPTPAALALLASCAPLVEIGAGGGYWAKLLRDRGAEVAAFDVAPHRNPWVSRGWSPVAVGGPDVLEYVDGALFVCWPAHETALAGEALARFRGDTFAYAGELDNTPDRAFDEQLAAEWRLVGRVELPHWPGFDDDLTFWSRA